MRLAILLVLFFISLATHAQPNVRIGVESHYVPHFGVRELQADNVRPWGFRIMMSNFEKSRFEIGGNLLLNYEEVAIFSAGAHLAYMFAEVGTSFFKTGVSLGKITLQRYEAGEGLGAHVGDTSFEDFNGELKPYLEWEWIIKNTGTLFIQAGYRIINGNRRVVTEVEGSGLERRTTASRESFFYAGSGFDFGVGISFNLLSL